jgi:hypothetical protein
VRHFVGYPGVDRMRRGRAENDAIDPNPTFSIAQLIKNVGA